MALLRITDPACGTGTLLMAAAERIRDLSSAARHDRVSQALIENVLTGYDVKFDGDAPGGDNARSALANDHL